MFVNCRARARWIAPLALALAVTGAIVAPIPASAQMTIGEYNGLLSAIGGKRQDAARADDAREHLLLFHNGMDSAIAVANAAFVQAGAKPSFCLPANAEANLILLSKVTKQILYGQDWAKQDRLSVGRVAIAVVTAEHPCK